MKFFFDKFFSLFGLIFFSPIFVVIPTLIILNDFGNPFYIPFRIGKKKKKI